MNQPLTLTVLALAEPVAANAGCLLKQTTTVLGVAEPVAANAGCTYDNIRCKDGALMFTIISYDIIDDRRRTKVMKYLKGWGTRVQYSVFECDLDARAFTKVLRDLRNLIDPNTDSVRCYRLDEAAVKRIQIVGIGVVSRDPTHYFV